MDTGVALCTGDPVTARRPVAAAARQVTTVSDCWLVAQRNEWDGSKPYVSGRAALDGFQPVAVSRPVRGLDAKVATLSCPRLEA